MYEKYLFSSCSRFGVCIVALSVCGLRTFLSLFISRKLFFLRAKNEAHADVMKTNEKKKTINK